MTNAEISGAIRQFAFWVANGTVAHPLGEGIDYRAVLFREPSSMERMFAIFTNVLLATGDAKRAERRAAEWMIAYCDPARQPPEPLTDDEIALH
jgi:hypothetical protein